MKNNTDILYIISTGFTARTVLHSDLIPQLRKKGLSVAVASRNAQEDSFRRLCQKKGALPVDIGKIDTSLLDRYQPIRKYIFEDIFRNPPLKAKFQRDLFGGSRNSCFFLLPAVGLILNLIVFRFKIFTGLFKRLEEALLVNKEAEEILREINPALVVCTYPVNFLEAMFILAAKRIGIRSVGQILSWDNITSKGRFAALPDEFISWGPIMTNELFEFYDIKRENVSECGVAHFDTHFDPLVLQGVPKIINSIGLDNNKPYILFGMNAPYYCPKEVEIVEWLAEEVLNDVYGEEMQLIIRLHPLQLEGDMAQENIVKRLRVLSGPRVALDIPNMVSKGREWNLDENDLPKLSGLLEGCCVCLNSGSTLTIDALLHNKPVIWPVFDAGHKLPWWNSVTKMIEYTHIAKIIDKKGVYIATSFDDLRSALKRYIAMSLLDEKGRGEILEAEFSCCDGRSSERIAETLVRISHSARNSGYI